MLCGNFLDKKVCVDKSSFAIDICDWGSDRLAGLLIRAVNNIHIYLSS